MNELLAKTTFTLKAIGVVRSAFTSQEETPKQPMLSMGTPGWVEIFPEYEEGLKDIEGFERIYVVYVFHRVHDEKLIVTPYLDTVPRGVFATRAPCRPNRIGISCVKLTKVDKNKLEIEDVDILDGTPVLDIKPYVPQFDCFINLRAGWVKNTFVSENKADIRL